MAKTPTYQEWLLKKQYEDAYKECLRAEKEHFRRSLREPLVPDAGPSAADKIAEERLVRNQSILEEAEKRLTEASVALPNLEHVTVPTRAPRAPADVVH